MAASKQQVADLKIDKSEIQDNQLIATWKYVTSTSGDMKYFKDFKVVWTYSYKDGSITVNKTDEHTINNQSQTNDYFDIPSFDLTKVKTINVWVEVTPECNKKEVKKTNTKGKKTTKQEDAWVAKKTKTKNAYQVKLIQMNTPTVPPVPTVEKVTANQGQFKLKVSVLNYKTTENYAKSVTIQSRRNRDNGLITSHIKNISAGGSAIYTSGIMSDGTLYQFRAKGWSEKDGNEVGSEWSEWSDPVMGKPKVPSGDWKIQTSHDRIEGNQNKPIVNVVIEDNANNIDLIDGYVIWYSNNIEDLYYKRSSRQRKEFKKDDYDQGEFESRGRDHHIYARCYLPELDDYAKGHAGNVWFTIQAMYGDTYSDYIQDYNYYKEYKIGSAPLPPSTWTRRRSFVEDEQIDIYWNNNSTDGSFQTKAQIQYKINGTNRGPFELNLTTEVGQTEEKTYSISYPNLGSFLQTVYPDADTSILESGAYDIQYQIRTMGAYTDSNKGWSDWSSNKLFQIYRQPVVKFEESAQPRSWIWDPFDFRYDTIYTAYDGTPFSDFVDDTGHVIVDHFPIFIGVESGPEPQKGIEYSFQITSLSEYDTYDYTGETIHVSVGEIVYSKTSPPTKRYYDNDTGNYCLIRINAWDISLENGQDYRLTVVATMNSGLTATLVQDFRTAYTDSGFFPTANIVLDEDNFSAYIIPSLDTDVEFDPGEEVLGLSDVVFHVFRRNYDGSMTEIVNGLNGDSEISVIDPHPALNGASYRIVGMSKKTGEIVFNDIPGTEFEEKPIIIQWDDEYKPFDILDGYIDETEDPENLLLYGDGIQGNMIKLPYNIDATNEYDMDKELVNYIGREHPVSYYGTQKGESLSLSTVIPKTSKDIIYALRRLSNYPGDCYIREPNGTGFWANVTASFSINHLEVTVPISIKATRVEGGV